MKKSKNNTVLIAIVPSRLDFEIAKKNNWYRIPVKSAPKIVKEKTIKYLAFYHPGIFDIEKYSIRWYAKVDSIKMVKRKELFPNLVFDPKAEIEYYKINFGSLLRLPQPIISLKHRRILFVPTSEEKFFNATEINYLFNGSPLEDLLWDKFVKTKITAERQFYVTYDYKHFVLDFAIFCKNKNINIECDGDEFHTKIKNVYRDKQRNNILESKGWSVLRFSTNDIIFDLTNSYKIITSTINNYGGIQDNHNLDNYLYLRSPDNPQLHLFD